MRCSSRAGGEQLGHRSSVEAQQPPAPTRHERLAGARRRASCQQQHPLAVLASLLLLLVASCLLPHAGAEHAWHPVPHPHPKSFHHKPSLNVHAECPGLKIAVVNGVNFHFEVLAGLLTALRPYAHHTDVYLSPHAQTQNFNGAWEIVRWFDGVFRRTAVSEVKYAYDLVVLVSPDYELKDNMELLEVMKPAVLVAYVHNAGFNVSRLQPFASRRLVPLTLSPHVAEALANETKRTDVEWLLPIYPFVLPEDCLTFPKQWVLGLCLRGFAMQGKFSNLRRNYSSIWRQMTDRLEDIRDPQVGRVFFINVLGKGQDRLNLPKALEAHVKVHRRLIYTEFFSSIGHNVALVPSLAGDRYYTEKFSSTMLTSLITGTPVLASPQLLQAYRFLTPESVYQQREGEEEVDAMIRVAQLSADDIIKVRLALLDLRDQLNKRAGQVLERIVREACQASAEQAAAAQAGGDGGGGGAAPR